MAGINRFKTLEDLAKCQALVLKWGDEEIGNGNSQSLVALESLVKEILRDVRRERKQEGE
jgi:hypothetical protein